MLGNCLRLLIQACGCSVSAQSLSSHGCSRGSGGHGAEHGDGPAAAAVPGGAAGRRQSQDAGRAVH